MKILGTGLKGMVGSRIVELLNQEHQFDISDADITDRSVISKKISESQASVVLHLAAKTDVDLCQKDEQTDREKYFTKDIPIYQYICSKNSKTAWEVNVIGTKNIVDACLNSGKRLIYVSTDFVFDGINTSSNGYSEESLPNPINWYGKTKYEGEKIIQTLNTPWVIARIAYPYRASFSKNDFMRAIFGKLQSKESVAAITDHIMTPTFVDDIARAIDTLINESAHGIYHVTGSQFITPYDAACLIAETFGLNKSFISKAALEEYFKGRAPRPSNLSINNSKIRSLGVDMKRFDKGLEEIKRQLTS